jgi:hypothetical protein
VSRISERFLGVHWIDVGSAIGLGVASAIIVSGGLGRISGRYWLSVLGVVGLL